MGPQLPDQGLNLHFLHCKVKFYSVDHQGSPILRFLLESFFLKVREVTEYVKLLKRPEAEEGQDTLLPTFQGSPLLTNPNWHQYYGPSCGTRLMWSQPCLGKPVWGHRSDGSSLVLLLHFRDVSSKLHWWAHSGTLPAPSGPAPPILDHPCVFLTLGGFSVLLSTFWFQCQSPLSPSHPPPQRLSEAAPFVIGISLMKKGWCLSHYSYSEWEDLRTNLLALTREDTSFHQEVHFPAACGNKRTRFVLTLIRWENREFPKEIPLRNR